jgi:tRNA dimethylallyltransferase
MQAYIGMDIGTAKPPAEELARLPHHLLSIRDPTQQYNVGEFVSSADALIPEIRGRGRIPVVSGGTAFYVRTFLFGLPESPPGSLQAREALRKRAEEEGHEALYQELARSDPRAAERIPRNDRYRVMRALEILQATGRSVYTYHWPRTPRQGFSFLLLGLERPRDELHSRIQARVDRMMRTGLVDEVRGLMARGCGPRDPGMLAIGYREFFEMQKGCATMACTVESIQRNTRRYAKRQMTFFRSVPGVEWMNPDDGSMIQERIQSFL